MLYYSFCNAPNVFSVGDSSGMQAGQFQRYYERQGMQRILNCNRRRNEGKEEPFERLILGQRKLHFMNFLASFKFTLQLYAEKLIKGNLFT